MLREAAAEFLGTFVLIVFGVGVVAQTVLSQQANGSYLGINIGWGLGVMLGVYTAAGGSGAHLNPAVTVALAARRACLGKVPVFVAAQVAGAFVASAVVFLAYREAFTAFDGGLRAVAGDRATAGIFATYPQPFLSLAGGLVDQVVGTALLLIGVLAITDQKNAGPPGWLAAPLIGALVVAIGVAFGFNAGYAINPARDFGPRLFTFVAGWGREVFTAGHGWWWVPIVGPSGGCSAWSPTMPASAGSRPPGSGHESLRARPRPGHDLEPRHSLRPRRAGGRAGTAGVPAAVSGAGHVEHDPEAIWSSQLQTARDAWRAPGPRADLAAIGVTNQRETTILWERATGRPVANAIVWQSRVTAPICDRLRADGHEPVFRRKTGLVLDAYFSGTKIKHLLDSRDGLRDRAARGEVLFGTVESFLIWRLTGGRRHVTDISNASRTLLFNIHTQDWDDELLRLLDVPRAMLPEVRGCSETLGETDAAWLGGRCPLPAAPATSRQRCSARPCFEPGAPRTVRARLLHAAQHRRPPCPRRRACDNDRVAPGPRDHLRARGLGVRCRRGGAVALRDGLHAIEASVEVEALTAEVADTGGIYLVPAFVGLGAPAGTRAPVGRSSASRATRRGAHRPGGRRGDGLPDP